MTTRNSFSTQAFFEVDSSPRITAFLVLRVLQSEFFSAKSERNGIHNTARSYFAEKFRYVVLKQKSGSHLLAGKDFC